MGYQPTLATELAELEARITSSASGTMTSVQAVYVPADDITDPSATHTFAHLSATSVLSRSRAAQGLYPAIDPLRSDSKMLTPTVVGERHHRVAHDVRRVLAEYEDLKDIISMLGMEELSKKDRETVNQARRLERLLAQPFFTTEPSLCSQMVRARAWRYDALTESAACSSDGMLPLRRLLLPRLLPPPPPRSVRIARAPANREGWRRSERAC